MSMPLPKDGRVERIKRLEEEHPPTTVYRREIRRFVRNCAKNYVITGPILDAGCGYRSNEPEIASHSDAEYYTLDADPRVLPSLVGSVEDHSIFSSSFFGTVICTEVLEHTPNPKAAISNFHRLLCEGGMLILTVPFWVPIHERRGFKDYWRFTPTGLKLLLDDFSDVTIERSGSSDCPLGLYALANK